MIKVNDDILAYTPNLADARAAYDKACYSVASGQKQGIVRWYKDDIKSIEYSNPEE